MYTRPTDYTSPLLMATLGAATLASVYLWQGRTVTNKVDPTVQALNNNISKTYAYIVSGITLTTATAILCHLNQLSIKILYASPVVSITLPLISTGFAVATMFTPKENQALRHATWSAFHLTMGISLSPLCLIEPELLIQAATITLGVCGSFSIFAFLSPETFRGWGGMLSASLLALTATTAVATFFPGTAFALVASQASTYGGLALFCGFMAYEYNSYGRRSK